MAGGAEQRGRQPQQPQQVEGQQRRERGYWVSDKAAVWGFLIVGGLFGSFAYIDTVKQQELKKHLPKTPIEQVDNKCERDIMSIGDLKLRMPKTELFQQVVYSKDQTPPQQ